jgi:hypothetical protein
MEKIKHRLTYITESKNVAMFLYIVAVTIDAWAG